MMAFRFSNVVLAVLVCALAASGPAVGAKLMAGGVIVDAAGEAPVPGVTVAVFNDDGEVVATDVTDEEGLWAAPVEWGHCQLKEPPRGGGLFSSIVGVATWPVRQVVGVVSVPAKAALKTAIKAAGGAVAAGGAAAAVAGGGPVAIAAAGAAGKTISNYTLDRVVGDPEEELEAARQTGVKNAQVTVRVWKPGAKDFSGSLGIYMLDQIQGEDSKELPLAVTDAVLLADESSGAASKPQRLFGIFRNVSASPLMAEAGSSITVSANLVVPAEIAGAVHVVGHDLETDQDFVLLQTAAGVWQGQLLVPEKGPFRNHRITLVAYRSLQEAGLRDAKQEDRIEKQGAWDPGKPFPVDPAVLACRNRGMVQVTVFRPAEDE